VGFENNLQLANGEVAIDNAALVSALAEGLPSKGRKPASGAQARLLLGMY
jgi:uncharacterized protein (DUF849 family)